MEAIQENLFDIATIDRLPQKRSRIERQREKAKKAYAATSVHWRNAFYKFAVNEFLPFHATFIFEELTLAYNEQAKTGRLPVTIQPKALYGIQQWLLRDALIEMIPGETRKRTQGTHSPVYKSLVFCRSG